MRSRYRADSLREGVFDQSADRMLPLLYASCRPPCGAAVFPPTPGEPRGPADPPPRRSADPLDLDLRPA